MDIKFVTTALVNAAVTRGYCPTEANLIAAKAIALTEAGRYPEAYAKYLTRLMPS